MSYNHLSFDWTPERCEQLRELWASGLSAAGRLKKWEPLRPTKSANVKAIETHVGGVMG